MPALGVFLVDPHLAAVEAPTPAADDSRVGWTVGAEARALLDHAAPVLAPAGTVAVGVKRPPEVVGFIGFTVVEGYALQSPESRPGMANLGVGADALLAGSNGFELAPVGLAEPGVVTLVGDLPDDGGVHGCDNVAEGLLTIERVIARSQLQPRYGSGWQPV